MQCAVIDIGSNSIRLSVYDAEKTNFKILFKEKIMAGLASNVLFERIISEAIKRGFGILPTRKNLRSGSKPKTEILWECSHTPYACSLLVHPEWKGRGCGIL